MSIHKKATAEFITQQQAIAYETYKVEKAKARRAGQPHSITLRIIEQRHGLQAKSLDWFIGNHNRK